MEEIHTMTAKFFKGSASIVVFLILIFAGAGVCSAQYDQTMPPATSGTPAQNNSAKQAPPKINKPEEDAYKALTHPSGAAAQIQQGEDFIKKFPDSHYIPSVYGILTSAYFGTGDIDKMFVAGNKALELNPDNVDVLSLLSMAIPRRIRSTTPDAAQQMQKAEAYAHHAIELIPNLPKPPEMDDATFEKVKNDKLSLAHSGLGLIDTDHDKYDDARTELMLAVQLASNPDPVDYYLLGNADVKTSYLNGAVAAYDKCAASGPLMAQCKARSDSTKKDLTTSLSKD
jgi:tetratricopeptide (TPR) repeat protein